MKKFFNFNGLSSICFFLLSSVTALNSWGDQVITPFSLELSSASTQALLGGVSGFSAPAGVFQTTLPDQTLTTPYAVTLSGIHLTLDYSFDTPTEGSTLGQWSIQSNSIGAQVVVDLINASQTIVESSGGSTLTLNVNATCTDVVLQLTPGSTQMDATVNLALTNGQPSFELSNFSANWTPGAWQIISMNCQGPNGFEQLIQQAAATQLQSINPFLSGIEQQIQAQLNSVQSQSLSWVMQVSGPTGVTMALQPQNLQLLPSGGALIDGTADFNFSKLQNTKCQTQVSGSAPSPSNVDALVVPVAAVEALIQCAYMNGSFSFSWTSQNFSAFQSLLGNWFEEIFVWPNLTNFDSNSIFGFVLFPVGDPQFGAVTTNSSGDFLFDLSAPVTLGVSAPTDSGEQNYVDFSTSVSGPATLSVENGVVSFSQKTSGLSLSASWDPIYVQEYQPDQSIWTSIIAGEIKNYLSSPGLSYTLPTMEVPGSLSMAIQSAVYDGQNVQISLDIKKLSSPTR